MKRLIAFLLLVLAFCFTACAADRVTAIITITNAPSDADTITINASARTWKNTVVTPSTQIAIGASAGAAATNLFRHLSSYTLSGPVVLGFSSSNVITIVGQSSQAMSASLSAAYGTVSYTTNTVTPMYMVRVPFTGETAVPQTNNATQLAIGMGSYSQSPFATNTTLVSNLVQVDGNQTIAGRKTFLSQIISTATGGLLVSNTAPSISFWDTDADADEKRLSFGYAGGQFTISSTSDDGSTAENVLSIDFSGTTPITASFIPPLQMQGGFTNDAKTFYTRANHTAFANGNNAGADFGNATYVKLKAGPSAAFAICGITGGSDGRMLIIDNSIAQNMTIANDSGVEPTAANRIYTRTGSDVTTTGQGVVTLIYDSEDSRWVLVSVRD
jgi:hypothetical protein